LSSFNLFKDLDEGVEPLNKLLSKII